MKTFFAVVSELLEFLFSRLFSTRVSGVLKKEKSNELSPRLIGTTLNPIDLEVKAVAVPPMLAHSYPTLRYFVRNDNVKIFTRPVVTYDGVLTKIPFGSEVIVLTFMGRFAEIKWYNEQTAWVLKDDLTDKIEEVVPFLQSGQVYLANNLEVQKLRHCIADEFGTIELYLPLQDSEMVTFYLLQEGRQIPWPSVRPRLSGNWQRLLRGKAGVSIGVSPVSGGIMEYIEGDMGFVMYTKEVLFDNSVVVYSVGRKNEGEYLVERLPENIWQALRPVWISLT